MAKLVASWADEAPAGRLDAARISHPYLDTPPALGPKKGAEKEKEKEKEVELEDEFFSPTGELPRVRFGYLLPWGKAESSLLESMQKLSLSDMLKREPSERQKYKERYGESAPDRPWEEES